jgi:hypothetical protein
MANIDLRPPRAAAERSWGDRVGLIAAQDIVRDAPESCDDCGVGSNARCVFAESDVMRVVGFVLDCPVLADSVRGEVRGDGTAGQIERGSQRKLPQAGGGLSLAWLE